VQPVTCQPRRPWRSVSRTVSSTALWNDGGSDPRSTSSRYAMPEPGAAGSTRSPTVAAKGLGARPISSNAAPVRAGRSTQSVIESRNSASMP